MLTHAGGYSFDGAVPIVAVKRKRIYSNTGYDLITQHVADVTGIEFSEYLKDAIFAPLGMNKSFLNGSGASAVVSCVDDLVEFALELRNPNLISVATANAATTTQFAELEGVVPGVGRFDPCNWGLGPEIHGSKHPHWMGTRNSASTLGTSAEAVRLSGTTRLPTFHVLGYAKSSLMRGHCTIGRFFRCRA